MRASAQNREWPEAPLRPPSEVMRMKRMGSFFATRLSFMRVLVRELMTGSWQFDRPLFEIDDTGFGTAVYRISNPARSYSLLAFSHDLPPAMRTDRVIAEAWDATFALFDGTPSASDIKRLRNNVPRQEAGRYTASELVLCRANKSLRYFDHVVGCLADGKEPDQQLTREVGYLMRTTAVYGNGKFGIADRYRIEGRPEFGGPFQAEMLAVYLVRLFTLDLVEHVARAKSPATFRPLSSRFRRYLGIGNATGLGMAPFLMTHPRLVSSWMLARETALARVRVAPTLDRARLAELIERAQLHLSEWRTVAPAQTKSITELKGALARLFCHLPDFSAPNALYAWAMKNQGIETQELIISLLLELYPERVDGLASTMAMDETLRLDGTMPVSQALSVLEADYGWALRIDCSDPRQNALFWYVSEEKLEPRLGNRYEEPGAELERPFAVPRDMQALYCTLKMAPPHQSSAEFLMRHPVHRHILRRLQIVRANPYGEIYDNLVSADCHPIDLLRCKLSFFGAVKFDPKSDRWTRITMYQGAPLPGDLKNPNADDWSFPSL